MILEQIADELDAMERRGLVPQRIEIGQRQAEEIAAALGRRPLGRDVTQAEIRASLYDGVPLPEGDPYTADEVLGGEGQRATLYGVHLVGVESPDHLRVAAWGCLPLRTHRAAR